MKSSSSSSKNKSEIVAAGTYYSDQFEFVNEKLRQHFKLANDEIDNVKDRVNELVVIIHDDNKDWSLTKICAYIAGKNDDLEELGFSAKTIMNYLDEQNRQLKDTKKQTRKLQHQPSKTLEELRQQKGTIVHNNVMEPGVETFPHGVLEHSSSTTIEDVENDEGEETIIIIKGVKYDQQYINNLIETASKYEELIVPFPFRITATVKGQDLPFIVKVDPYKRVVTSLEVDEKEAKKLNK